MADKKTCPLKTQCKAKWLQGVLYFFKFFFDLMTITGFVPAQLLASEPITLVVHFKPPGQKIFERFSARAV